MVICRFEPTEAWQELHTYDQMGRIFERPTNHARQLDPIAAAGRSLTGPSTSFESTNTLPNATARAGLRKPPGWRSLFFLSSIEIHRPAAREVAPWRADARVCPYTGCHHASERGRRAVFRLTGPQTTILVVLFLFAGFLANGLGGESGRPGWASWLASRITPILADEQLQGCRNDLVLMRDLLIQRFGFSERDVVVLPTRPQRLRESAASWRT